MANEKQKQRTKISLVEYNIDPKKVEEFPGSVLSPEDIKYERIKYTIGTWEYRIVGFEGKEFYRDLPITKKDVLSRKDVELEPSGYLDDLLAENEAVVKRLTYGIQGLYEDTKRISNNYVLERAEIKKKFIGLIRNAYNEHNEGKLNDLLYKIIKKELKDKYKKEEQEVSDKLAKLKENLKEQLSPNKDYSVGIEKLIDNLEFFSDGIVIGSNPASKLCINDGFISDIQGIILVKEDKIVYNDLSVNRTLVCTKRNEEKGLVEFEEEKGGRVLIDMASKYYQLAHLFLGSPVSFVPKEQRSTVESLGFDAVTASLKLDAKKHLKRGDKVYSKHYICIAKGGKSSSE